MNPTYEHHRPYDGCDLYRGDALDVLPLLAEEGITADMVLSDPPYGTTHCRWDAVWEKTQATGFLNAGRMPMKAHEDILVFYDRLPKYHPIKTDGHRRKVVMAEHQRKCDAGEIYRKHDNFRDYISTERYPRSVLKFKTDKQRSCLHATQKPVALLEYLIRTYTDEGDIVLDFAMGSGSTAVACRNTGRRFVGVEIDREIFQTALNRITHG